MSMGRVTSITVRTAGKGFVDITERISRIVADAGVSEGLTTVFLQHTSASLLVQENADPSVRSDLEAWMSRNVPENADYAHDSEGPDDMPSHIRTALTAVSVSIPILNGRLALGTWQALYLWEHRRSAHDRHMVVHIA
ncbi:MAG TPA: secondary thiamine-phosphate synthase enzyme YjbQ [Phycisphaerales bacterium]|nr:secondary thiamine-phosphate synthase enzyme YjbQ [Phycisphaerales bacterium]